MSLPIPPPVLMHWLELKLPPLLWWLICVGLMWCLAQFWPLYHFSPTFSAWRIALAAGFTLLALMIALAAVWRFRQAATTVHPMQLQRSTSLVQDGIFRYSRNPMYLAMLLGLAGVACWLAVLSVWLGLPLFLCLIQQYQIKPEERWMASRFGAEYQQYRQRVRRWI